MNAERLLHDAVAVGYWIYVDHQHQRLYAGNDCELAWENILSTLKGHDLENNGCAIHLKKRGSPDEELVIIPTPFGTPKVVIMAKKDDGNSWAGNWAKVHVKGVKEWKS